MKRLNPLSGLKRIFSSQVLAELLKGILKATLVGWVTGLYLWHNWAAMLHLMTQQPLDALGNALQMILFCGFLVVLGLTPMVAFDVFYQLWSHFKKLKMTKQDIRDEFKDQEGDPHVKGRIRQQQRAIARRRMMADVPKADVIVTNPTHYAVALQYNDKKMSAPKVLAKGAGEIALRIRELGAEHRIPMLEAPPLARALYRHSEIGQHIPATLYAAVAEVLAWVYQLRRWRREGGLIPKNLNVYRCRKHWILRERVTLMANLASLLRLPGNFKDTQWQVLAGPVLILLILSMMVLPLPAFILDLLFTFNIALSIMVLLVAMFTQRTLEFAAFPTILLFSTLLRLSLNVASTRIILLEGHTGSAAAGRVVEAFGHFLVGGNFAIGIVVFIILVLINFMVITKGAGRIAEVGARFVLDGMPGKQMAIDADLNAGLIGEDEAKKRRAEVTQEADFYGSMDGASKFVRGDAIAGLMIMVLNVVGGLLVGVVQHGMELGRRRKAIRC